MPYDYAIHSDFLIHWTGKDIDEGNDWYQEDKIYYPKHKERQTERSRQQGGKRKLAN